MLTFSSKTVNKYDIVLNNCFLSSVNVVVHYKMKQIITMKIKFKKTWYYILYQYRETKKNIDNNNNLIVMISVYYYLLFYNKHYLITLKRMFNKNYFLNIVLKPYGNP